MKKLLALFLLLAACGAAYAANNELACLTTEWKVVGSNDKVCVYWYVDPKIPEVSCYVSQARTGGLSGSVGVAEDPAYFSLSCTRTGPITLPPDFPEKEQVFKESTNIFFKATRVTRIYDKTRQTLVYIAVSPRLIEGSPYNAVVAVPLK